MAYSYKLMIKHLPANLNGRDFVCGDIHGCYSLVEKFLERIYFDESKDRLISVGDLIDRGPENEKCIDLMYQPWFHMVMGNHEYMMVDAFSNPLSKYGAIWLNNGGVWGAGYRNLDSGYMGEYIRGAVEDVMRKLPLIITVDRKSGGKFHVIHAELYHNEPLTDDDFADAPFIKQIATRQTHDGDFILWGRRMFLGLHDRSLDNRTVDKFRRSIDLQGKDFGKMFGSELSHIYSGHTIIRNPIQMYKMTNLDTMAFGSFSRFRKNFGMEVAAPWAGLTFTEPETGKFWLVNERQFTETQPLVII